MLNWHYTNECGVFQTQLESKSIHDDALLIRETRTLEECSVAGVGKFTAFSDGSLRVVFDDRTCLDMRGLHWEPHVYNRLLAQNVVSCDGCNHYGVQRLVSSNF